MESLTQNKPLLFSLVGNFAVILLLACGFLPDLAVQFEIVDFPSQVSLHNAQGIKLIAIYSSLNLFEYITYTYCVLQFRTILVQVLVADFVLAYIIDRVCLWLFGEGRQHKL